jgi:4-amino-4-deoxy-L-arabinose transferase-like glycosyltransferase
MLGPLLNRKSDLSVRKGVLLYKKLICPMMDYACLTWRSAARSHVRRVQVLHSKCLGLATGAPWYVSNRQIHDHIRALTSRFNTKLADVGNHLVRQIGRYLR